MNIGSTFLLLLSVLRLLVRGRIGHSIYGANLVRRGEGSHRDWQWYLKNTPVSMNVKSAWQAGYTGKGVLVAVVDDGVNMNHPDLRLNFNVDSSYDFLRGQKISRSHRASSHGTSCAGIIAGGNNTNCGVGIAYDAQISSIRMYNRYSRASDQREADALSFKSDVIDIYSNSWGPRDAGWYVKGPGPLLANALKNGTQLGRRKKGSIFVYAVGNGGVTGDSCAFNGYVNSIYTIAISGVNWDGKVPGYAEPCAAIMAVTYGQDNYDSVKVPVITTKNANVCTDDFPGTSASAAMASGIIALALEANPELTWRDIQHLIVRSSKPLNPPWRRSASYSERRSPSWRVNNANLRVSKFYGFGLMDANDMVRYAKNWTSVPQQLHCEVDLEIPGTSWPPIPWSGLLPLSLSVNKKNCGIRFLEHVEVQIDLTFPRRGYLEMFSESPRGTQSKLLYSRVFDSLTGRKNFTKWTVSSLHYWGEDPDGDWKITIKNSKPNRKTRKAVLVKSSSSSESPANLTIMKSRVSNHSAWSAWSLCSATCGDGQQTRYSLCTRESLCVRTEEVRFCTSGPCSTQGAPIDGGYSSWSHWSWCSKSCGKGSQQRFRKCNNPSPANGGADCKRLGKATEKQSCSERRCPVDGGYTEWSSWGSCSKTCNGGTQRKIRSCSNPTPAYGGKDCWRLGPSIQTRSCNPQQCPDIPVHGGYTPWSNWGSCSESCGVGMQFSTRSCSNPKPANKGKDCKGPAIKTRSCYLNSCPVDGGYTNWSGWSTCSKTCNGGTQRQIRYCSNPTPAYGGRDCWRLGPSTQTRNCSTQQCSGAPIDGGYSPWSFWSRCSKSCGDGSQQRSRICTNPPPANGGADCKGLGEAIETRTCRLQKCSAKVTNRSCRNRMSDKFCTEWKSYCTNSEDFRRSCAKTCGKCNGAPIDGGYSPWSFWSRCSKSCGDGSQQRSRICTNPPPANGGADCKGLGEAIETRTCRIQKCPAKVTNRSCRNRMSDKFCTEWKSYCTNSEDFRRSCAKTCGKCNG